VVTQPYITPGHREQQRLLVEYLRKRFSGSTQLAFVDLGPSVELLDPALAPDGMHLSAAGNSLVAQGLVSSVRAMLDDSFVAPVTPVTANGSLTSMVDAAPVDAFIRTAGAPRPGSLSVSPIDARSMAWVPPGTFQMGSPVSEAGREGDESLHRVTIGSGFWMDTHEVTNAAFQRFTKDDPTWSLAQSRSRLDTFDGDYLRGWDNDEPPQGKADHPVVAVTWAAAGAYCAWAGKRLPTEAEWEYAARAGTTTAYWWGDAFDATRANRSGAGTEPVGHALRVNPWGLADMAGNVWEWTSSRYQPYPYRADDEREDPGPGGDGRRVLRGGAWVIGPAYFRSADRFKYTPRIASDFVGFRCVENIR
jgi:formylglycine-generating enzyme required for sulfatase activity